MTLYMTTIVVVAIVGLATRSTVVLARQRKPGPFLASIAVLAALTVLLHRLFGFPFAFSFSASKTLTPSELPVIGVLFACMMAGMLAHWLYVWLETPRRKRPGLDVGRFLMPVLVSPVIFIPLLASQQNADLSLSRLDVPRFMVLLVAFENGFFWKEYFDNRNTRTAAP